MTILEKIIAHKRKEVAQRKQEISVSQLEACISGEKEVPSLKEALTHNGGSGIIAEYKRQSPSKGIINNQISIEEVAKSYEKAGASAMSVLTDKEFFGGMPQDLTSARDVTHFPLLRKDFIIDPFQVLEARAIGASAILLISAALTQKEVKELAIMSRKLGMEVLFEVHNRKELEKWIPEIEIVGVNNRDLHSFEVTLETSKKLAPFIPSQCVKVSESGIRTAEDIRILRTFGYRGFLIGENFMATKHPGSACKKLIEGLK